jgi:hypothetical protein
MLCRMAKKPEAPKPTTWTVYKIAGSGTGGIGFSDNGCS